MQAEFNQALALHQQGKLADAERIYSEVLRQQPNHFDALHLLGVIAVQTRRTEWGIELITKAIGLNAQVAEAYSNLGIALKELKRLDEALGSYDKAIALKPDYPEAHSNRGNVLNDLKRPADALVSCDKAIGLKPDYAEAFSNRGNALRELKRLDEALASYDKALALKPDYAEAFSNRGNALRELKRLDEAVASYDKALALKPDYAEAFNNRGVALQELKRFDEALASYEKALALKPNYADAFYNRGIALQELKRLDEAVASYDRALVAKINHADAFSGAADCVIKLCDWDKWKRIATELHTHIAGKKSIISPFTLLGYSGDPGLQLQCARNFIENRVPLLPRLLWTGESWRHDKLRVAYLSADFRRSAMAHLIAELFERQDRSRFEIVGVSFGVDDKSEMRKRLVGAFDQFYDVRRKSDEEVAKLLHDLQIDIAIDLMGYTRDSRPGILAYRPAPIQASYLGFAGTMGAEFIDYIIADETVAPFEHQPFYTEKIVHLPHCYLVNDTGRKIPERTPTRQEAGLPQGFVFCCFNNDWKITPDVFSVWMQLLHAVQGSVLWLSGDNESAERNLRKEAQARGINPARLVFAGRLPLEDHLARHRLADLFLDTLPYNAHTTASDALWVGLPLLTREGTAFAGRVAASLLNAIGLPELVTHGIEDYEALALRLARDPALLEGYRNRLATNRLTHPLFDTDRFRRHIEAAYLQMSEIWQRGEQPRSFAVEAEGDDKIFLGNTSGIPNRPATAHLGGLIPQAVAAFGAKKLDVAEGLCREILRLRPSDFDALHLLGAVETERGHLDDALRYWDRALALRPDHAELMNNYATALRRFGCHKEILGLCDRALAVQPDYAEALFNRGVALQELKRLDEAVANYDQALAVKPDHAEAFFNRGIALQELKRLDEALASYDKAIALKPDYADAFNNRGVALQELKRYDEALASYDKALALKPDYAEAFNNRGVALQEQKRLEEALASYDRALALKPDYADAFNNRGNALQEQKRLEEALASYDRALALKPDYADAFTNRGNALQELKRLDEALASYDKALALKPNYAEAFYNRGTALQELKRLEEAVASYDRALVLKPDYAETFNNRGNALKQLKRLDEALASYDRALIAKADHAYAFSGAADCVIKLCDWDKWKRIATELDTHIAGKKSIIHPFVLLGYSGGRALQLQCARSYIEHKVPSLPRPLWTGETWRHDKVRIAYLSADFRSHPVAYLIAELFEQHDRSRFKIIGVSLGVDDHGDMRKRLVAAFDEFHDVRRKSDEEIAKLLYDLQIDVAIDLKGYTQDSRLGIFAHRPAPIQVNYLGYPGTMGADFIDYIIADKTVAPFEHQPFYTEKIVHLPDCYQVNDRKRKIAAHTPTREEAGLPAEGFVFCCFNNNWKITPDVFERLDAALACGRRQRAVAVGRQRECGTESARGSAGARDRAGSPGVRRTLAATRTIWRATDWPTYSSTRCPIMPTPRRATRCGWDFRC